MNYPDNFSDAAHALAWGDRPTDEPREHTPEELAMMRAITAAEQKIREAVHCIRSAAQLPEDHAAQEILDGFVKDGLWVIGYLTEARRALEDATAMEAV